MTPYLLPRDYNGSSANFIPPEMSAPLAPRSILGVAWIFHPGSGKIRSPDLSSPYGPSTSFQGEIGDTHQRLLAGPSSAHTPNEALFGSMTGEAMPTAAVAHVGGSRTDSDYEPPTAQHERSSRLIYSLQGSRSGQSLARQPPAVHANSGPHFSYDTDPDEVFSQTTTQLPAYTAS